MLDAIRIFQDEAAEHLSNLEEALLILEVEPDSADQVGAAFRAMHTIKGSAGMVGFDHLSYFTHHLETFFDEVRSGQLVLNEKLIALVLECKDHIEQLLTNELPEAEEMAVSEVLKQRLQAVLTRKEDYSPPSKLAMHSNSTNDHRCLYRLDLLPNQDTFREGFDVLPILRELHGLGSCHISSYLTEHFDAKHFDPETCYLGFTVLITGEHNEQTLHDVFMFVQDDWEIQIKELDLDAAYRLGDLLIERGVLDSETLELLLNKKPRVGDLLTQSGIIDTGTIEQTLAEQQYIRAQQNQQKNVSEPSLKVPQHKLDQLMDQVGELVILQAYLDQLAQGTEDERLLTIAEEMDRLNSNLRETVFDIRMLPIGSIFGRFRRLARDLSMELGKKVHFVTQGAETELDKVVLDRLGDPLIHLLRNSLDHGLETPEVRVDQGKSEQGTLTLSASHNQGQILISIQDDGAGLDSEKILKKAIEKGLISTESKLDIRDIHQLIFEPGFSTASAVTDVSGRGVGMDVVRSSIDSLQGRIVIDSEQGRGTRIEIYLPMTLAIIDGLMVAVGGDYFIVPLNTVEECIETQGDELSGGSGARLIKHRQKLLPCLRLREYFNLGGQSPDIEQTVVLRSGENLGAITVDQVIGQFQTVIKNLGQLYRKTSGVMGATVMGDGGIAMILDVAEILKETDQ